MCVPAISRALPRTVAGVPPWPAERHTRRACRVHWLGTAKLTGNPGGMGMTRKVWDLLGAVSGWHSVLKSATMWSFRTRGSTDGRFIVHHSAHTSYC